LLLLPCLQLLLFLLPLLLLLLLLVGKLRGCQVVEKIFSSLATQLFSSSFSPTFWDLQGAS
jgi:hypothetical protein